MRRVLDVLRTDDVPLMSRRNYVVELRHLMAWGMFSGIVEGNISTIVVYKTFGGSEFLARTVWSIPFIANMLTIFLGTRAGAEPKLRRYAFLGVCAVVSMASIGLTPSDPTWSGWLFAAQLLATRLFLAGVVALRTTMWNANYPRAHRARLVGRLQAVRFLIGMMTAAAITRLFDWQPECYRFVYPGIATVGLVALLLARPLRVRGEAADLAQARAEAGGGGAGPLDGLRASAANVVGSLAILREDPTFARYCGAQMLLGSANMMIEPLLTIALMQQLAFEYFASSFMMDIIPVAVMLIAMQFWAPYFDRVGVVRFRVANGLVWFASFTVATAAMLLLAFGGASWSAAVIGMLVAARIVTGCGRGGGAIAWHIGHLHFARRHNAERYMKVHMALTGLRGVLVPQIGGLLSGQIGNLTFLLGWLLGLLGLLEFWSLSRADAGPTDDERQAERLSPSTPRTDVT